MSTEASWYIVKQPDGHCTITAEAAEPRPTSPAEDLTIWGPFPSQSEAIARRVGLIRAGKCQPN